MKKTTKILLFLLVITGIIISQTGCTGKNPVSKTSYYMDTICEITIYDMENMSEKNAEDAIDNAFGLCADYENLISMTKEGSDIYRINHAGGEPVKCDPATVEVINLGIEYGKLSDGRFDITIGKVSNLWDFHGEDSKVPARSRVEKALTAVDYRQIQVDGDSVSMKNPEGEINLGGIGKGFIADRAVARLLELGVTSAVVNFGGNIVTIGDKGGEPFRIGVEEPYSDRNEILGAVDARNAVIVTSGTYERYIEADGKKYHHILDIEDGFPVDTDVVSVSIVGEIGNSARCDALSTICLIYGVEEGERLIESIDGFEAVFIDKDGRITQTSGMDFSEI